MHNIKKEKKHYRLPSFFKKKPVGKAFWVWVTYQAIKGTLTLSFIWIPMLYLWFTQ